MEQVKKSWSESLVHLICAFAAALLVAGYLADAKAQNAPLVLREQINVFSNIVTIGDLFENAGNTSESPVFRSPSLGSSGVVSAKRVASSIRQHGLAWPNMGGITEVSVARPGRKILLDEVRELIRERAASDNDEIYTVTFSRGAKPFYIDPRAQGMISVKQMEHNPRTGRFRVVIAAPKGEQNVQDKIFTGRAFATVEAIVPTRLIERGATILDSDLKVERMPRQKVSESAIVDMASAVGMAAKQRLIASRPIRRTDLEMPKLVKRNTIVTILYQTPGLILKAKGRALADGSHGQTVAIINLQSERTLDAKVTGNGLVSVSTLNAQPVRTAQRAQNTRNAGPARQARSIRGRHNTNIIR